MKRRKRLFHDGKEDQPCSETCPACAAERKEIETQLEEQRRREAA